MKSNNLSPKPIGLVLVAIALLLTFFCLQLWWLDCWQFQVLAGDDLRSFLTAHQGFKAYNNAAISVFKFRPITALLMGGSAFLSGGEYPSLLMIGVGLHSINTFIFFCLLRNLLGLSLGIAGGLTFISAFNRFTAYLMTPELSIMEGTAITCYLLFAWAFLRLIETQKIKWALGVGFLFFIILHVHERYMVLAGASFLLLILAKRANRFACLLAVGSCLAALALNFGVKKLFTQTPILIGTTTQAIEFNARSIIHFFLDGLINLVGINCGPSHLSILNYTDEPSWLKLLSIISTLLGLLIVSLVTLHIWCSVKSRHITNETRMLVALASIIFALVLAASITFRQEYRWLYPAYLTFLMLLGLGAQVLKRSISRIALWAVIALTIPMEIAIREHRDNYYARSAYRTANDLYALIKNNPDLSLLPEIVIGGDTVPAADWVFMGDLFAKHYALPTLAFAAQDQNNTKPPTLIYRQTRGFALFPGKDQNHIEILRTAQIKSLFTNNLATPNGTPSFAFTQHGVAGWAVTSPVTLAIKIPGESSGLALSFSHCWKHGDGVDLTILGVGADQQAHELLSIHIKALKATDQSEWQSHHLNLSDKYSDIILSVQSKSGDQTADWTIFRNFSFDSP